jgi:ppGpp synthetase/RelA/SpoT-type nucleotidyltranferase
LIELEEKLKRGKGAEFPITHWEKIYRILEYVRREQRSYLFDRGDKTKNHAGLWLREKEEILWRIKNYVLLFSETEDIEESNKNEFLGWNAHDLYYYIRSLIPMEIQVRTELTNTFAVQYHDDIYKTQTHTGTEFIHTMMKNAGESLDKIDRELEIDYEDYILKSRHLKKGKE